MNDVAFRAVLDWLMCSDPWPSVFVPQLVIEDWLDREAREKGYDNWLDAYHRVPTSGEQGQFGVGA